MLNGKLSLGDVKDVEALCTKVVEEARLELSYHDHEECIAWLIETAWEAQVAHERSGRPGNVHFKLLLKRRLIDWRRSRIGRTRWQFKDRIYERKLPEFVSLDDSFKHRGPNGESGETAGHDRRIFFDHGLMADANPDRWADVLGLQRARGGKGSRSTEEGSGAETDRAA